MATEFIVKPISFDVPPVFVDTSVSNLFDALLREQEAIFIDLDVLHSEINNPINSYKLSVLQQQFSEKLQELSLTQGKMCEVLRRANNSNNYSHIAPFARGDPTATTYKIHTSSGILTAPNVALNPTIDSYRTLYPRTFGHSHLTPTGSLFPRVSGLSSVSPRIGIDTGLPSAMPSSLSTQLTESGNLLKEPILGYACVTGDPREEVVKSTILHAVPSRAHQFKEMLDELVHEYSDKHDLHLLVREFDRVYKDALKSSVTTLEIRK